MYSPAPRRAKPVGLCCARRRFRGGGRAFPAEKHAAADALLTNEKILLLQLKIPR